MMMAALLAARGWRVAASMLGVTLTAATVVLTRSRAGYLAAAAALLIFLGALLVSAQLRSQTRTWMRFAAVIAIAAVGVVAAMFVPNSLRWRSDNPYLESFSGVANFQEGSGAGRLVQYRQSLGMLGKNPVFGVGPGNWSVEYPAHAARRDPSLDRSEPGTTSNPWPSSDWVAFLSERGVVAALALAGAFLLVALQALRQLRSAQDFDHALAAATLLATVVAVNVAGMFDAVLMLALPALLVWAAIGALWVPVPAPRFATLSGRIRRSATAGLLVLAAVGALRSAAQLVAMGIYTNADGTAAMRLAARVDPANYRVRVRLARGGSGLRRAQRCDHAQAAHKLFPNAAEARSLSRSCD
jgi:O-antigen ligase